MIGFDATHSGRAELLPQALMTTPTVKWSHDTEGEVESSAVLSPDEKLVFSAGGSEIFALDAESGRKAWGFRAQSQVLASPALADGALFVGADDNTFYALEQQTGLLRWKYDAGGEFTGGAIASNNVVYAGCSKPALFAWSTAGDLLWEHITTANVASTPAADEQSVYFGDDAGHFHCLNKQTGAVRWVVQLGLNVRAPAAVHADVLYVSSGDPDGGQSGEVFKLAADSGKVLWRSGCNGDHTKCDSCWTTPTLLHSLLVVGCGLDSEPRGKLWGLNEADGAVVWSTDMPHDMQTSSPIRQRDGSVLIGSVDGHLYSIDATDGKVLWKFAAGSFGKGVWATAAVASDGTVFVGSHLNKLFALSAPANNAPTATQAEL